MRTSNVAVAYFLRFGCARERDGGEIMNERRGERLRETEKEIKGERE